MSWWARSKADCRLRLDRVWPDRNVFLMEEIVNKVEASGLVQIELRQLLPEVNVQGFDLADHLWQGMVLREKEFRAAMKALDPARWAGAVVAVHCSADAIVPDWAWMLVAATFGEAGVAVEVGNVDEVRARMHARQVEELDVTPFENQRIVVKGCSAVGGPGVLAGLVCKLQPVVKSLMFGEACSTVPIFKRRQ